jgi:hypothetical protein
MNGKSKKVSTGSSLFQFHQSRILAWHKGIFGLPAGFPESLGSIRSINTQWTLYLFGNLFY